MKYLILLSILSFTLPCEENNLPIIPQKINIESIMEQAPELSDYRSLPGDSTHDDRVAELMTEARLGKIESLLLLGEADINKDQIIILIKSERGMFVREVGSPDFPGYVLAKLGDVEERKKIEIDFDSGVYMREDESIHALEYVADKWAISVLLRGLSTKGGKRKVFADDVINESSTAVAPPLRYECVKILSELFPESKIGSDSDAIGEDDISNMIIWILNNHKSYN